MAGRGKDVGYYALPIVPSIEGIDSKINEALNSKLSEAGTKAGEEYAKAFVAAAEKASADAPKIEPKIDTSKLDEAVEEAVEEAAGKAKPVEVELEPKVDPGKVEESVQESVTKSKKPKVEIEPKVDPGQVREEARGAGRVLRDTINESLQDAADGMGMPVEELKKKLGEKIGTAIGSKIGEALSNTDVGKRIGEWADQVRPVLSPIGDALAAIREHDAGGALNSVADGLRNIGQSGAADALVPIAARTSELQTNFGQLRTSIQETSTGLMTITGNQGRISGALAGIGAAAGPLAAVFAVLQVMPGFSTSLNNALAQARGEAPFDINPLLHVANPGLGLLDVVGDGLTRPFKMPAEIHSPVAAKPGIPMIPGAAPAFEPPTLPPGVVLPPGVTYSATPGSLDPFAGLSPTSTTPSVPMPVPVPIVPVPVPVPNPAVPGLGSFVPPDLPGHAGGGIAEALNGMISGPGSGTSDSILGYPAMVRVSNGEFLTNAEQTAKQRPLLEMVNAGVPLWDWMQGLPRFAGGGELGDAGGLMPFTQQLRSLVQQTWPMITNIGGYRSPDGYNEHSSGRALDVMIPNWQSPAGISLGNQIAQWALAIPGVNRVMWQQSIIYRGGRAEPVADRGSPTQNHMDHVHIFTDAMPMGASPQIPAIPGLGGAGSAAVAGSIPGGGGGIGASLGALASGNGGGGGVLGGSGLLGSALGGIGGLGRMFGGGLGGGMLGDPAFQQAGGVMALMSILTSGIGETFGFNGSLFPDISGIGNMMTNFLMPSTFGMGGGGLAGGGPGADPFLDAGFGSVAGGGNRWMPGGPTDVASQLVNGPANDFSRHTNITVNSGPTEQQIGQTVRQEVANVDRIHSYMPVGG